MLAIPGRKHPDYLANFDIEDDDRILRVECTITQINSVEIESLLKGIGVYCKTFMN